jgi:hypothetical protein
MPESHSPTRRTWRKRAVAAALATLATVLSFEIGLRIAWRKTFSNTVHSWHEYDELLGWRHRRSFTIRVEANEGVVRPMDLHFNASGLRDARELPVPARAGVSRIACLGDSYAFGWCVSEEAAFPRLLESSIAGTEVWDWGVAGYGVDQCSLQLERDVLPTKPDLVLLTVIDADLRRATGKLGPGEVPKPRFTLASGTLELTNTPVPRLRPGDSYYRVDAEGSFVLWSLRQAWTKACARLASDPDEAAEKWVLGSALIREMAKRAAQVGVRFAVALLPTETTLDDEPLERLLPKLERDGIPVLNVCPAFRKRVAEHELLFLPRDRHPNEAGHRLIAEEIARQIAARGLAAPK